MTPQEMLPDPKKAEAFFANKTEFTAGPVDLERMLKEGSANVIDVRAADDFVQAHVPGAKSLPREKWDLMAGLDRERVNVVYCYSQNCHLAATAARKFAAAGYPVMELEGGFDAWKAAGYAINKGRISENEAILT